jgi:hypothetical protein
MIVEGGRWRRGWKRYAEHVGATFNLLALRIAHVLSEGQITQSSLWAFKKGENEEQLG